MNYMLLDIAIKYGDPSDFVIDKGLEITIIILAIVIVLYCISYIVKIIKNKRNITDNTQLLQNNACTIGVSPEVKTDENKTE